MKASCSFFDNTAPVWYKNTLIYNSPYCANCHLNSQEERPSCFLYILHPISESGCEQSCRLSNERQRLQQSLGHLPLLWGESLSAPCARPLQTIATGDEPASAVGDELSPYKEGTVRQGGICSVEIDEDLGGSVDGGWDRGRSADHHGLARWCCCWRENNRHWERMIASNGGHAWIWGHIIRRLISSMPLKVSNEKGRRLCPLSCFFKFNLITVQMCHLYVIKMLWNKNILSQRAHEKNGIQSLVDVAKRTMRQGNFIYMAHFMCVNVLYIKVYANKWDYNK